MKRKDYLVADYQDVESHGLSKPALAAIKVAGGRLLIHLGHQPGNSYEDQQVVLELPRTLGIAEVAKWVCRARQVLRNQRGKVDEQGIKMNGNRRYLQLPLVFSQE